MITVFIDPDDNKEHQLVTQQYEVGTYCIIDSDPAQQFSAEDDELTVHRKFRKQFKYILEKSTVL